VAALAPHLEGAAVVVPAGLLRRLAAPASARSGFPEETTAVERAAMDAVIAAERALGREPRDVSDAKCGYDIESRDPGSGALLFIEVKGRRADADSVIVTKNEIMTALNKPDAFILAIVRVEDGYGHEPRYVREPFQREPDFAATSVTYRLAELLARAEAPR
jgi:hypothetical protein